MRFMLSPEPGSVDRSASADIRWFLQLQFTAVQRLVRDELSLLRMLGRDRRLASRRLTPVIRSGPAAMPRQVVVKGRPAPEREAT